MTLSRISETKTSQYFVYSVPGTVVAVILNLSLTCKMESGHWYSFLLIRLNLILQRPKKKYLLAYGIHYMKDMYIDAEIPTLCYTKWKATFPMFRKHLIKKPTVSPVW